MSGAYEQMMKPSLKKTFSRLQDRKFCREEWGEWQNIYSQ